MGWRRKRAKIPTRSDIVWGNLRDVVKRCKIPPQVLKVCIQIRFLEKGFDYVELPSGQKTYNLPRLTVRASACLRIYCDCYGENKEQFMRATFLDQPVGKYYGQQFAEQHTLPDEAVEE